eukprot:503480-Pleurochrysis_carterae.AAC.1
MDFPTQDMLHAAYRDRTLLPVAPPYSRVQVHLARCRPAHRPPSLGQQKAASYSRSVVMRG